MYKLRDQLRAYINGKQLGAGIKSLVEDAGPLAMPNAPMLVGDALNGTLDELAFYRRALPPERISAHFDRGAAGR